MFTRAIVSNILMEKERKTKMNYFYISETVHLHAPPSKMWPIQIFLLCRVVRDYILYFILFICICIYPPPLYMVQQYLQHFHIIAVFADLKIQNESRYERSKMNPFYLKHDNFTFYQKHQTRKRLCSCKLEANEDTPALKWLENPYTLI